MGEEPADARGVEECKSLFLLSLAYNVLTTTTTTDTKILAFSDGVLFMFVFIPRHLFGLSGLAYVACEANDCFELRYMPSRVERVWHCATFKVEEMKCNLESNRRQYAAGADISLIIGQISKSCFPLFHSWGVPSPGLPSHACLPLRHWRRTRLPC